VLLDDCPRQFAGLREAAAAERPDELMTAAHGLKGALRVLGASTAADLAEGLELIGREHRLEGLAERVEALRREPGAVVRRAGELLRAGV
jgi:HPt (histidine-containing phosphotransfer) domain-containing protein